MNIFLLIKATIAFFVIMDPIGNTPIFISLLKDWEPEMRRATINRAVQVATAIFLLFAFLGSYILGYLGISLGALQVAGGILLMIVAFAMIHGHSFTSEVQQGDDPSSFAVTPMAIPLMAGPAALTTVMLYMSQADNLIEKGTILLALLIAIAIAWIIAIYADKLCDKIHKDGIAAATQIMGVVLAALAIELAAHGLKAIFPILGR